VIRTNVDAFASDGRCRAAARMLESCLLQLGWTFALALLLFDQARAACRVWPRPVDGGSSRTAGRVNRSAAHIGASAIGSLAHAVARTATSLAHVAASPLTSPAHVGAPPLPLAGSSARQALGGLTIAPVPTAATGGVARPAVVIYGLHTSAPVDPVRGGGRGPLHTSARRRIEPATGHRSIDTFAVCDSWPTRVFGGPSPGAEPVNGATAHVGASGIDSPVHGAARPKASVAHVGAPSLPPAWPSFFKYPAVSRP
jgi:hypothetical protein